MIVFDADGGLGLGNEITLVYGGQGNDNVANVTAPGPILGYGGSGNDRLVNFGPGQATFYGGSGGDLLEGTAGDGADRLYGGAGDDFLAGRYIGSAASSGPNWLDGGPGRDVLDGASGSDTIFGGDGDDGPAGGSITAGSGGFAETASPGLFGFLGDDWLYGGNGNDFLYGENGNDRMFGGLGNDSYGVLNAGDVVSEAAGGGDDTVYLDLGDLPDNAAFSLAASGEIEHIRIGADTSGKSRIDVICTNGANEVLAFMAARSVSGLGGNDVMISEAGDVVFRGGLGNDRLTGGAGKDAFVFDTAPNKSANVDTIVDFSHADDTIRIDNAIFKAAGKNGRLAKDAFFAGKKAGDAEDRFVYDKASGALFYDADGTGKIAAIKIAILQNKVKIDYTDFLVI